MPRASEAYLRLSVHVINNHNVTLCAMIANAQFYVTQNSVPLIISIWLMRERYYSTTHFK